VTVNLRHFPLLTTQSAFPQWANAKVQDIEAMEASLMALREKDVSPGHGDGSQIAELLHYMRLLGHRRKANHKEMEHIVIRYEFMNRDTSPFKDELIKLAYFMREIGLQEEPKRDTVDMVVEYMDSTATQANSATRGEIMATCHLYLKLLGHPQKVTGSQIGFMYAAIEENAKIGLPLVSNEILLHMKRLGLTDRALDYELLKERLERARKERDGLTIARILNMVRECPPSALESGNQPDLPPVSVWRGGDR